MTIYALGVELELAEDLGVEPAAALDGELNAWASSLGSWLSVLVGGPTGYLWNPGAVSWPKEIGFELQSKAYAEGRFNEPDRLSAQGWRHALAHAGDGDRAPLSRVLLATAVAGEVDGDNRAAVLDAATASELALNEGIVRYVRGQGTNTQIADALIKGKTLGAIVQLARAFSLPVPSNAMTDLVEIRNKAAHKGWTPTEYEVRRAIEAAVAIVNNLDPLAVHCTEAIC